MVGGVEGGGSAELVARRVQPPERNDVAAEQQGQGPVEDDADLAVERRHPGHVVRACMSQAGKPRSLMP